ncbi:DNA-binding NarL/FixJ family response regulator [Sphaerotilus sulfidivorans]|uniref:DNA-binding NarL/FixJ family response regulator n=1 Tax=Sphaerotilus sulfidivorans TaxID=639200 RepID=A0A5C1Q0G1_9BURK|nr:response regulator transcription factor [Sphaerotilus sulfidivorans]NZD44686.1 response regulator transcription factor [Sphaerotilus sulfidivorans]QEN00406.1 response regulator transcription factor [Sphaerotilus sulfidivorans]
MRILIVDDHPLVREGVRTLINHQSGLEVVGEAADADSALEAIARLEPALVLTDIGMKQVSGIALAAQIRERWPAIHVIVLSMYDNPDYVHQAMQAGARGYVLKDAPSSDIVDAIRAVAAGDTFLSASLSRQSARSDGPRPILSEREAEILACLARGLSSKQIAAEHDLSVRTVETHRQNIRRKLRIEGQAELIRYAVEHCRTAG